MRVAVVSKNRDQYSETFIHDHVKLLSPECWYLHGDYLPLFYSKGMDGNDHSFLTDNPKIWFKKQDKITPGSGAHKTAIARFLKENKIEIVLAEYGPSGVEMMEVCKAISVPFVVHFHGYDAYRTDILNYYGKQYPQLFAQAAAIIVVSNHMKQQLIRLGAPQNKIFLNPYGIDPELFPARKEFIHSTTFFAAGRFCETKSPHLTLFSFSKMKNQAQTAKLVMAGDGLLLEACKILANALNISDCVHFPGVLQPKEISEWMQKSLAFVQHSYTTSENDKEGTPVTILEAAMSGLPVISTLHAGIPEAVEHDKTGFLVDEGDVEGMANYMLKLFQNPQLGAEMGKAGKQKIEKEYLQKDKIQSLKTILETVRNK